jgi:hypothetical protein
VQYSASSFVFPAAFAQRHEQYTESLARRARHEGWTVFVPAA